MKNWVLVLSIVLNLVLVGVLAFLNERYGLLAKVQRVALVEGRVPGVAAPYELNREYQVRREMFLLDKNESARVLMLGDSLTVQGEWNAMLGEPLVANRGIDGDTSAGVLARIGDDADFRGDAVVVWVGTNDVLQGVAAGAVVENINRAVAKLKGRTTNVSNRYEKQNTDLTTEDTESTEEGKAEKRKVETLKGSFGQEAGLRLAGQVGAALGKSDGTEPIPPYWNDSSRCSALDSQRIFVLSVPPMARWWEGARERNTVIREINVRLVEGAGENGYRFIELESVLADESGFLRGELTSDGVHLNAKGYVAVIQRLKEAALWPLADG